MVEARGCCCARTRLSAGAGAICACLQEGQGCTVVIAAVGDSAVALAAITDPVRAKGSPTQGRACGAAMQARMFDACEGLWAVACWHACDALEGTGSCLKQGTATPLHVWCRCGTQVMHVCCMCGACVVHVCCMCGARVVHVCCMCGAR